MSKYRPCYCGECCFVKHEDMDGFGYCELVEDIMHCGNRCVLDHTKIKPRAIVKGLRFIQKWRRGAKTAMPSPYVIGKVNDAVIYQLRKMK